MTAYEIPAYIYEEPFSSLGWETQLELLLGAYPLVQFLLGIITIAGVLFLLDRRTRRIGLLIALPPIALYGFSRIDYPIWSGPITALILLAWTLWAVFRPGAGDSGAEGNFYPTPSWQGYTRIYPIVVVTAVVGIVLMGSVSRRAPNDGARALVGHRMVNHRGAWTYQPAQSQSDSIPKQTFDIYFSPFGYCESRIGGADIKGRLLAEPHLHNIHLDCLPNNTRLYADFEIKDDTLVIHNHKNDLPFRLQFVKKNWGPGWYSDFLPGFLTK